MGEDYSSCTIFITDPQTGESREIHNLLGLDLSRSHESTDETIEEVAEALAGRDRAMEFTMSISLLADEFMRLFLGLTKPIRYRTGIIPKRGRSRQRQRLTRLQRRKKRQNKN